MLTYLGQQRWAFNQYLEEQKRKLADGSIRQEVYDKVLATERARLQGSVAAEKAKLKRQKQRFDELAREEVYERVLGAERARLGREAERLRTERLAIEEREKRLPMIDAAGQEIDRLAHLIQQQLEAAPLTLPEEKTRGFPWVARAHGDLIAAQHELLARVLEVKDSPAPRAAEAVRTVSLLRRKAEQRARILEYQLRYYEALFPWLADLTGEGVDELLIAVRTEQIEEQEEESADPARRWLTDAEYASLSNVEKFQLALDRYWQGRKTPWQIGRDYERFVGFRYEQLGFHVYYQGIVDGLEDLGRDLIATKETVQIIQCKRWSSEKEIHEKHVNQLFGTMTAYKVDHPDEHGEVRGVLYTTTRLSERAREFAEKLGIKYVENFAFEPYPCIKCNVSRRDGSKIYHLPFDQQYDRTVIEEEQLERYASTITEAESLGFRRAFRWRGSGESTTASPASGGSP